MASRSSATWTVKTRRLMAFPDLSDKVAKDILSEEHKRRHKPAAIGYLEKKVEGWSDSSRPQFKYEVRRSSKVGGGVFVYIRTTGGPIQKLRFEQMDKGAPGGEQIRRKVRIVDLGPDIRRSTGDKKEKRMRKANVRPGQMGVIHGRKTVVKGQATGPLRSQVPYLAWNYYEPSTHGRPGYFSAELRIRRTAPYTEYELHRDKRRANRRPPAPITRGPIRARRWTEMLTNVYFGTTTGQDPDLQDPALVGRNIARTAYSRYLRKIKESPLVELK